MARVLETASMMRSSSAKQGEKRERENATQWTKVEIVSLIDFFLQKHDSFIVKGIYLQPDDFEDPSCYVK